MAQLDGLLESLRTVGHSNWKMLFP